MSASHFRVLVLDDTERVVKRIEERIQGSRPLGQLDPVIPVDVQSVCIELEPATSGSSQEWVFSASTARSIAAACERPPDLILVDYGFVQAEVAGHLREEATKRDITDEELKGKVLTAYDLAKWCQEKAPLDPRTRARLRRNLFDSGIPVYMYSYPSRELLKAAGSMDQRAKRVRDAFSKSQVSVIDARQELYNGNEFDSPSSSKHDPKFYAFQIAVLLDYVVQKEILRKLLARSRYLRVRRTAAATAALAAIGSAVGMGGHWTGGLVTELLGHGSWIQASALAFGVLLSLFVFGFAAALLFERAMEKLLIEEGERD